MTPGSSATTFIAFGVAAAVTCAATPLVRWLATRSGAIDHPNERKVHARPLPTWGGLAIILGFLAAAFASGAPHRMGARPFAAVTAGALLVSLVGFVDDRKDLPARVKLALQVVATVPLLVGGVTISVLSNPFGHGMIALPNWLALAATVLWVVGVTNAINLIDGLDGLAAGVSAIACVTLAYIALAWGQPAVALVCAALAGAALGFLPWNWRPAGILMGDTGAYFLGYTIGAITVMGAFKIAATIAIFVPILVLAVPLLDTALSPVRRFLRGRPAFAADREHLHHRLLAMGLSESRVVLLTYIVTAVCGAIALWISRKG